MDKFLEFTKEPGFIICGIVIIVALFVITIINIIRTNKIAKKYKKFISKFSKGANIEILLNDYANSVEEVRNENVSIRNKIDVIEKNSMHALQKVGIVRYNAFADTGSDLCFALALLDFENNGVVINGVYSRDNTTTTYAKPVEKGVSKYTLSKEESEAIEKAKRMADSYFINVR